MQKTGIEYLDMTLNPIAMRCTPVSEGCDNCWHILMAKRLAENFILKPEARRAYSGGPPWLNKEELAAPIKRKKPARIGVQFMGDLFHEDIPNEWIAAVFGAMAAAPQHQFFVLTKRAERAAMRFRWVASEATKGGFKTTTICGEELYKSDVNLDFRTGDIWPLPNVWLGVSVEDQKTANERIPVLLQIPAAKRWVSYEPALGHVDFDDLVSVEGGLKTYRSALYCDGDRNGATLDLVTCGAETGPGARPCNLDWLRSVRGQCASYGVPFFLKQINAAGNRALDGMIHSEMP